VLVVVVGGVGVGVILHQLLLVVLPLVVCPATTAAPSSNTSP
jgi:hypothetical protein